jgi:hypothetical protein
MFFIFVLKLVYKLIRSHDTVKFIEVVLF